MGLDYLWKVSYEAKRVNNIPHYEEMFFDNYNAAMAFHTQLPTSVLGQVWIYDLVNEGKFDKIFYLKLEKLKQENKNKN